MNASTERTAVLYSRASTEGPDATSSLDAQEATCAQYAETHGYTVMDAVRDIREGATLDRPGLDTLRDLVRRGSVRAVVVTEQDRLSRSLAHMYILLNEFEAAGVELHFVSEPEAMIPEGRMLFVVRATFAAYEMKKLKEAQRKGREARKARMEASK